MNFIAGSPRGLCSPLKFPEASGQRCVSYPSQKCSRGVWGALSCSQSPRREVQLSQDCGVTPSSHPQGCNPLASMGKATVCELMVPNHYLRLKSLSQKHQGLWSGSLQAWVQWLLHLSLPAISLCNLLCPSNTPTGGVVFSDGPLSTFRGLPCSQHCLIVSFRAEIWSVFVHPLLKLQLTFPSACHSAAAASLFPGTQADASSNTANRLMPLQVYIPSCHLLFLFPGLVVSTAECQAGTSPSKSFKEPLEYLRGSQGWHLSCQHSQEGAGPCVTPRSIQGATRICKATSWLWVSIRGTHICWLFLF